MQPANSIQYSNQRWKTDWNMETDRAGLSEEYEWLIDAGVTDACYGCLLHRYDPSILGCVSTLLMLDWNKEGRGGGWEGALYIYRNQTERHTSSKMTLTDVHVEMLDCLCTLHLQEIGKYFQAITYDRKARFDYGRFSFLGTSFFTLYICQSLYMISLQWGSGAEVTKKLILFIHFQGKVRPVGYYLKTL